MSESKHAVDVIERTVDSGSDHSETPTSPHRRKTSTTIIFQIFCSLWLGPIITLLWLNFSNHIIGASAWCPDGNCWLDVSNPNAALLQERMAQFNDNNRNLLGVLQLVAKALEVWFVIIAGALLYLSTMKLATRADGLPLELLTRTTDFPGIKSLLEPLQWTTHVRNPQQRLRNSVWLLIIFSIALGILCNLMGPATAILAIPTLRWITTEKFGDRAFVALNSDRPPGEDLSSFFTLSELITWTELCTASQLAAHNYSCTIDPSGYALDAWMNSALATHGDVPPAEFIDGLQSPLQFKINQTFQTSDGDERKDVRTDFFSNFVFWVPSRQIIGNLSVDYDSVACMSSGWSKSCITWDDKIALSHQPISTYDEYNRSLALEIHRNGPIVGFIPTIWGGSGGRGRKTLHVDADRQIRCYENYDTGSEPYAPYLRHDYYTKCIRLGTGWSENNKRASFVVPNVYDTTIEVDIYSSDRAAFFHNNKLPSWLPPACFQDGNFAASGCDWERFFTTDEKAPLFNRTQNVVTIEMKASNGKDSFTYVIDFTAYLGFTTYTLDISGITNPTLLVRTQDLPLHGPSVVIDPSWILAGWSVDNGGTLTTDRTSAHLLQRGMSGLLRYQTINPVEIPLNLVLDTNAMAFISIAHTLSLIDHRTTKDPHPDWSSKEHPLLQRNARMYVWGYFLASRTSVFAVVVAIGGIVIVVMQAYLGFADKRRYRGPTQLLVSALQHVPRGEFEGGVNAEKVRFRIDEQEGRMRFRSRQADG